jgi:tripartite-type tricarboxylate transporter receptor subunit TctC
MNALVAGQVDYMCDQIINAVPQIKAGNIKAYAIAAAARDPSLPDVPTTKEAGVPEFQASAWNALFAPKGTPKPILDKLTAALDKALDDEGVRKRLLDLGSDIPGADRRGQAALGNCSEPKALSQSAHKRTFTSKRGGRPRLRRRTVL